MYPWAAAKEFLRGYRDYMAGAPDELTVEIVMLASAQPPAHEPLLAAIACYAGPADAAERTLSTLRTLGPTRVAVIRERRIHA
jgi:hypothetical protein